MEKLKSMTAFVLEQGMNPLQNDTECWIKTYKYAEFLKQPLTLGMFIPCDLDGNVLEEPDLTCKRPESKGNCQCGEESVKDCREWWNEYQEAKDRVLFEGFELRNHDKTIICQSDILIVMWKHPEEKWILGFDFIEDLVKYDLELTTTAQKQIGL